MASKKILKSGTLQYTITSKALKPYKDNCKAYYTCSPDEETVYDAAMERLDRLLSDGVVPPELIEHLNASQDKPGGASYYTLAILIRDYRHDAKAKSDDYRILETVSTLFGGRKLTDVNSHDWNDEFVSYLKRERNLAEATVRQYVGALRRCMLFAFRKGKISTVALNNEKKGFSSYNDADIEWLYENGKEIKYSVPRNRRPSVEEWTELLRIAGGGKPRNRERALTLEHQAAFECILELAPETCMRLSELFTLTLGQVSLKNKTISLYNTKNTKDRVVPLHSFSIELLQRYMAHVENGTRGMQGFNFNNGFLFPFYPGHGQHSVETKQRKASTSNLLSHRYSTLFDAAGCPDLLFHDLRHEGISRLFERTKLTETAIQQISGHLTKSALERYMNLRPLFLAEQIENAAGMK